MLRIEISKKQYNDGLIQGIRSGQKRTLLHIYKKYYPNIKSYIINNSGSESDAQEVFQDAMMAIFQNVSTKGFELTSSFKTYLHSVSLNIWNKKLRTIKGKKFNINEDILQIGQKEIDDAILALERYHFYIRKFEGLSNKCQTLLKMYFSGVSMKRITEQYGFASISYTKKRMFVCKQNLIELIEKDPQYQVLIGHE